VTASTAKATPPSAPDQAPGSWPRYLAIRALRLAGRHDTTEAIRWASRHMDRPFTILGLTS
jgi:hypothetical protein